MIPHSSALRIFAFALVGALTPPALAIPFFSVNTNSDELVRIDSVTGTVTTVGSLGRNAYDIDLTLTGDGRLWGLNTGGGTVDIWEINKVTGAVISSAQVKDGSSPVIYAEGLGARGNQLKLGYDLSNAADSKTLGDLASNGAVTGGIVTTVDIDALADGGGNAFGLYAIDREPASFTTLYGISSVNGAATKIADYDKALGLHDLIALQGSEGFAIETFQGVLYRLNLTNGAVLGTVDIGPSRSGVYNGLALAEPLSTGVPDSGATAVLLGLGLAVLGRCRRKY